MIRPPYQLAQIGAAAMAVLLLAQCKDEDNTVEKIQEQQAAKSSPQPAQAKRKARIAFAQLRDILSLYEEEKSKAKAAAPAAVPKQLAQSFAYQEKRQRAAGTMQLAVNRLAADTGINLVLDGSVVHRITALVPGGPSSLEEPQDVTEQLEKLFLETMRSDESETDDLDIESVAIKLAVANFKEVREAHPKNEILAERVEKENAARSDRLDALQDLRKKLASEFAAVQKAQSAAKTSEDESALREKIKAMRAKQEDYQKSQAEIALQGRDARKTIRKEITDFFDSDLQAAAEELFAEEGIGLIMDSSKGSASFGDSIIGDEVFAVEADPQSELEDVTPKLIERIKKVDAAQAK